MRIVYFTSVDGWGGSESYLLTLMKGVQARGHEIVLLGIEGTRLFDEANAKGIECVAWRQTGKLLEAASGIDRVDASPILHQRMNWRRCFRYFIPLGMKLVMGNFSEAKQLKVLMKSLKPDVMHIGVNGYESAAFAAHWAGIPFLAMCMITPPLERYWLRRWLMRATVRLAGRVAAQSRACMDSWISFAGLNVERCTHIWNGVDVKRFNIIKSGRRSGEVASFRLLCAGRLHPMKGINYVIEAIGAIRDQGIVLDICGTGEEESVLRKLAMDCGVDEKIHFRGHVEQIEEVLARADAFVLASISHESGPAVLSEAMAAGLPLVTSDFGPLAEINVQGETGLVVPVHNVKALASAIRQLLGDPSMCLRMGQAARNRAEGLFSVEHMLDDTIKTYELLRCEAEDKKDGEK
jgi:glycosyltransferase involved in cell wall biosynthesis